MRQANRPGHYRSLQTTHERMCRMPCLLRRLHAHGKLTYTQTRPSFGKTQPAVSISPLQTTAKPKKHPSHKWIQIAAAVAIFMAGLGTGLSNFFSTQAEAVPSSPSFSTSLSRVHAVRPASPCRFTPVLRLTKISPTSIRNPAS